MTLKNFALIGAAGFVAPRHLKAIHDIGGTLQAALDLSDSVGIIDSYFPKAQFFTEFEQFDRCLDVLRRSGSETDYMSICSPNYLHDAHIRFALRSGCDAICEKPLVLNPSDIDALTEMEVETGRRIYSILQLRLHPSIIALREQIVRQANTTPHQVELTYITSRGSWYHSSWKGDESKSGGIATNIGVHLFDMLSYVFGDLKGFTVHHRSASSATGFLEYERAHVRWFLSIDADNLPPEIDPQKRTFRSITVDGDEIEFSNGFTELHTDSYRHILSGNGFGLAEVRPSIQTVAAIRTAPILTSDGDHHPYLPRILSNAERLQDARVN